MLLDCLLVCTRALNGSWHAHPRSLVPDRMLHVPRVAYRENPLFLTDSSLLCRTTY